MSSRTFSLILFSIQRAFDKEDVYRNFKNDVFEMATFLETQINSVRDEC